MTTENGYAKLEAIHMLTRTNIAPKADDVRVLVNDIEALANDELDSTLSESESAYKAAMILKGRIGGLGNLRSYVDTLLTGERRKQTV